MYPKGSKQGGNFRWLLYAGGALAVIWMVWFSGVARQYTTPQADNFDHMFSHKETFHYKDIPVDESPPQLPLCTVLSDEMMDAPELQPWEKILNPDKIRWRKYFEYSHLLWTLDKFGLLNDKSEGLAVAAGREKTMYYLSSRIKMMYAGDMYGDTPFASDGTSASEILKNPAKFAYPGLAWDPKRLKVMWQDARNLSSFKDNTLDFVYSLSSIEHFGGPDAVNGAAESIREQARVTKPGGIVYVAVDVILTGHGEVPGNGFNVSQIHKAIIEPAEQSGLKLAEPMHWSVSPASLQAVIYLGVFGVKMECTEIPYVMYCQKHQDSYPAVIPLDHRCGTSSVLVFKKTK